jgi:hypothetical protein
MNHSDIGVRKTESDGVEGTAVQKACGFPRIFEGK